MGPEEGVVESELTSDSGSDENGCVVISLSRLRVLDALDHPMRPRSPARSSPEEFSRSRSVADALLGRMSAEEGGGEVELVVWTSPVVCECMIRGCWMPVDSLPSPGRGRGGCSLRGSSGAGAEMWRAWFACRVGVGRRCDEEEETMTSLSQSRPTM